MFRHPSQWPHHADRYQCGRPLNRNFDRLFILFRGYHECKLFFFGRYAAGYICGSRSYQRHGTLHHFSRYPNRRLSVDTNKRVVNRRHRALELHSGRVYVSLLTNHIFEFDNADDLGSQAGMLFIPLDLGSIAGPPISAEILTASGGFKAVGY
ncbi:hypothetical protein BKA70DRAFT_1302482 [Coprinopsis sp. MPI-PUGE-AT-0042]|nr:hypothetical protein BKA70DRAFT_1302482 [Coprinopsis sp. MPI-PUGE-AT-0042]